MIQLVPILAPWHIYISLARAMYQKLGYVGDEMMSKDLGFE